MKQTAHQALEQLIEANDWALLHEKITPERHQQRAAQYQAITDKLQQYETAHRNFSKYLKRLAKYEAEIQAMIDRINALQKILYLSTYCTIPPKHQRVELVNDFCKTNISFNPIHFSNWCIERDTIELMHKKRIPLHHQQLIDFTHFKLKTAKT